MTQTWEVMRFELQYQLTRVSTRIYFAIFVALSMAIAVVFLYDARHDGYYFNAPIITAAVTIVASMFALLISAGVAGDAATRDADVRLDALIYTTPLRKMTYLGGRFLGAFVVTALLLLAVPIGLMISTLLPGIEKELLGPFRAEAYLTSYFFFAVPNAFVATAVLFALAAVSRRAITSYAGAAFLFFTAFLSETFLAARMGKWGLSKMLDPLAYVTLREYWRTSNPIQRNTLLIGLDGPLLSNRMFWLGLALSALTIAYVRFRFAYATGGRGWRRAAAAVVDTPAIRWTRAAVPQATRVFGTPTRLRQLLAVTMRSFRELITSKGWLIVPFIAVVFVITAPELLEVEMGTPGAATTSRVASMYAFEVSLLLLLLITLSAGELVWRERDARMAAIADVVPVPEWLAFLGRYVALGMMLALAHAILLLAGVAVQVMAGYYVIDLLLFVKVLFGLQLSGFLLFAALAMVVHVLVNQKYVANIIVLLAWVGTQMARELGIRHNLLLYGSAPEPPYTEMGGFGAQVGPWLWFTTYWSGWALLFAVLTYLFWIRGEERGFRTRVLLARRRFTGWPAVVAAMAVAVIIGVGGFVFYNTNILNTYYTEASMNQRRAEYERRYVKYASVPQPVLAGTKLHVEFYPDRGAATIRGTYRLENRTAQPIDTVHLATHSGVETSDVLFDRPSRVTLTDDDLGFRIYALDSAVNPGQSVRMHFKIVSERRGFRNDGVDPTIMGNGSWIEHRGEQAVRQRQWLPAIGYQPGREVEYDAPRRKLGLPARPGTPPPTDLAARNIERGQETIDFEATIGTTPDQIGVTTGALRRTWMENGRRYAHYVADAPISNGYVLYSGKYAIHRGAWRDVAIEIFHHPTHNANLDRMLASARASLDYHTREYGPYPFKQLRLIEYPSTSRGLRLTAHHGAIKYSEGYALVRAADDHRNIDFPFAVMAHEMGHQWWGHRTVPANVEGAAVLSESLAWYSAMMVVEETHGRDHLIRILDIMRREYLGPHETREVPLLRATDRLDAYRTGPFAMFALRETIGEERVNAALRVLLAKFPPGRAPFPTSLDLYAELRAASPPDMHYLLKDLFEEITFWDFKTKRIDVQPSGAGAYRVTLHVDAKKLKGDPTGKETPAPMNDVIDVAVFDADEKVLYRKPHRIRTGEQTITLHVTSARRPVSAELDPDHVMLDRTPDDNVAEVEGGPK